MFYYLHVRFQLNKCLHQSLSGCHLSIGQMRHIGVTLLLYINMIFIKLVLLSFPGRLITV